MPKTKMEWEIINEIGFIHSHCRKLYQICMDAIVQIEFICYGSKNQQKRKTNNPGKFYRLSIEMSGSGGI